MKNKLTAAFFDLGETLYHYRDVGLSWTAHYKDAWRAALQSIGVEPSDERLAILAAHMSRFNTREVQREVEYDARYIFSEALTAIGADPKLYEPAAAAFFGFFDQALESYSDTLPALRALKEKRVYIGALTDVAYGMPEQIVAGDLMRTGILGYLDSWKTSVQVGVRKPRPDGLLLLCKEAGLEPQAALYAGNERKDVEAARAAGLTAVLVFRSDEEIPRWGQDYTIRSLTECARFFDD